MLAPVLLILSQSVLICCIFFFRKRKKTRSLICAVALLFSCFLGGLILYNYSKNSSIDFYVYKLSIDNKKLESFYIDFDAPQQYEEWLIPYEKVKEFGETFIRKKITNEKPHSKTFTIISLYADIQAATDYYKIMYGGRYIAYNPTIKISEDYEYAVGDTFRELDSVHTIDKPANM